MHRKCLSSITVVFLLFMTPVLTEGRRYTFFRDITIDIPLKYEYSQTDPETIFWKIFSGPHECLVTASAEQKKAESKSAFETFKKRKKIVSEMGNKTSEIYIKPLSNTTFYYFLITPPQRGFSYRTYHLEGYFKIGDFIYGIDGTFKHMQELKETEKIISTIESVSSKKKNYSSLKNRTIEPVKQRSTLQENKKPLSDFPLLSLPDK